MTESNPSVTRRALETTDGTFWCVSKLAQLDLATREAMANDFLEAIRRAVKVALWGLAPIFGSAPLLALCVEVMAEDYAPAGPQTPRPGYDEEDAE